MIIGGLVSAIGGLITFGPVLAGAFSALLGPIGLVIAGITAAIAIGVLLYKNWDTIKKKATEIWQKIQLSIVKPIKIMKNKVLLDFFLLKQKIVSTIQGVKDRVSSLFSTLKTKVTTTIGNLKDSVKTTFEKIKSFITDPIGKAKDKISEIIGKIKDFFPISLKKIVTFSLPKIDIGTKSTKVGDKNVKSPTFGVGSWKHYAKAMSQPYLFTKATGIVAGEAGDEMIYGRRALMRDIAQAAGGGNITVNVYGSDGMSVTELANAVERKLIQAQKRRTEAWA